MKTAIITSESSEKHITGDGHPEQPKRVVSIIDTLKKNKELLWDKPDVVPNDILNMTHSEDYISNLNNSFPKSVLHPPSVGIIFSNVAFGKFTKKLG